MLRGEFPEMHRASPSDDTSPFPPLFVYASDVARAHGGAAWSSVVPLDARRVSGVGHSTVWYKYRIQTLCVKYETVAP